MTLKITYSTRQGRLHTLLLEDAEPISKDYALLGRGLSELATCLEDSWTG